MIFLPQGNENAPANLLYKIINSQGRSRDRGATLVYRSILCMTAQRRKILLTPPWRGVLSSSSPVLAGSQE